MSHLHSRPGVWGRFHQTIKVDDSSKSGLIAFTQGLSCLLCSIIRASCTFTHLDKLLQPIWWESKVFVSQLRDIISMACPLCAHESPSSWTCPKHRWCPGQMPEPSQLAPFDVEHWKLCSRQTWRSQNVFLSLCVWLQTTTPMCHPSMQPKESRHLEKAEMGSWDRQI